MGLRNNSELWIKHMVWTSEDSESLRHFHFKIRDTRTSVEILEAELLKKLVMVRWNFNCSASSTNTIVQEYLFLYLASLSNSMSSICIAAQIFTSI